MDARSQSDLIAALHLDPSISARAVSDKSNGATRGGKRGRRENLFTGGLCGRDDQRRMALVDLATLMFSAYGSSLPRDNR
jgi:hypothetical protein